MKWILIPIVAILMVNGQESKPHSNADKEHAPSKRNDATDATSQTIFVINQQTPQRQENSHSAKSPSYLCRLFSPENIPNLALVLVGIGAIVVAMKSLGRIDKQIAEMKGQGSIMQGQLEQMKAAREQTDILIKQATIAARAAKDSADAATQNANTLINAERPIVIVSPSLDETGNFQTSGHVIGRTPAMILEGWGERPIKYPSIESMPDEPPYSAANVSKIVPHDLIVAPGDKPFSIYRASVARFLVAEINARDREYNDLIEQREMMFFCGKVVYSDLLATDESGNLIRHETRWCYRYVPGPQGNSGFCVKAGKRLWNTYS